MESEILEKIKKLSPELLAELEDEAFLSKIDGLSAKYGVKGILIFLRLILGELDYGELSDYLSQEYGFNDFLSQEIKSAFGELIKSLGETASPAKAETKPELTSASASFKPHLTLPSKPAVMAGSVKSNFSAMTFSTEDDEEIKKFKNLGSATPSADYQQMAREIAKNLNFSSLDEILSKRLLNIIVARLKDIRDELETKEILMKGKKVGGLEQTEKQAEAIIKAVSNFNSGQARSFSGGLPQATIQPGPPAFADEDDWEEETDANLPALNPEHELMVIEDEDGLPAISIPPSFGDSGDRAKHSLSAPQEITQRVFYGQEKLSKELRNVKIKAESATVASVKKAPAEKTLPPARPVPFMAERKIPESVLNSRSSQRPNLDGVKFEKKLAGPIDELGNMTLIDFRRLAADPKIAVNKIKEKIDLLEADSLAKKLEGIGAWQQSEANKFYRLLGQSAMSDDRPVEDIIKERLFAGKPTLSLDEFYAIMELNRQLRF